MNDSINGIMENGMTLHKFAIVLVLLGLLPIGITAGQFDHSYKHYNRLLRTHVSDGLVDYRAIKAEPALMDSVNARFGRLQREEYESFTREQKMAYLLNAYNFYTIVAIVHAYPVESIKDIDGVWDGMQWRAAGRSLTLDNIEHDILRKEFDDARIHAAVVCASISCPALWNEAFVADTLDIQLDLRSEAFVRDSTRNYWDTDNDKLRLSKIFDWYGKDFIAEYGHGALFGYLSDKEAAIANVYYRYSPAVVKKSLTAEEIDIDYLDYDWSLNEQQ